MQRITLPTAKSIMSVTASRDWTTVRKFLEDERQATYRRMQDTPDMVALHELRGRARLLTELLDITGGIRQKVDKLEATARRTP